MSVGETVVDVVMYQGPLRFGHGAFHRVQLRGEVEAGLTLLDHRDDAAQMTFGALQAGGDGGVACVAVWFCHRSTITPRGGYNKAARFPASKRQMGKGRAILTRLAACVLFLALGTAPLFSALTHGPGQLAMEADHAAWHAEQGGHWHATDHDHHDAADHDHSPTVILPAGGELQPPPQTEIWTAQGNPLSGTIRDGPRRPPRLT